MLLESSEEVDLSNRSELLLLLLMLLILLLLFSASDLLASFDEMGDSGFMRRTFSGLISKCRIFLE